MFHGCALIFLLNLLLSPATACRIESWSSNLLESFEKFAQSLKSFYRTSVIDKLVYRAKIIKKAFNRFIKDAFGTGNNMRRLGSNAETNSLGTKFRALSSSELIVSHGYQVESHTILSADGYMLTLHRVQPSLRNATLAKIALLHHGLLGSSDDWLLLGPNKALPYLLSDRGYDVWLANARGNKYSMAHLKIRKETTEFWDFSWHEIGESDLSSVINYIRMTTANISKIDFIGHSMGCTALLVLLSTSPQYNLIVRCATFLAPLGFMYQIKGPLRVLAEFYSKYGRETVSFLGENEFMADSLPRETVDKFCKGEEILCLNPWLLMANGGQNISNMDLKSDILNHIPAGGSTKTLLHYCQLVKSGKFQAFDLGDVNNLKKYGTKTPPAYPLADVTIPIIIVSSKDDWLSTVSDIESLLSYLPNIVVYHIVKKQGFSHTDFVWEENAPDLVYHPIIDLLERIKPISTNRTR